MNRFSLQRSKNSFGANSPYNNAIYINLRNGGGSVAGFVNQPNNNYQSNFTIVANAISYIDGTLTGIGVSYQFGTNEAIVNTGSSANTGSIISPSYDDVLAYSNGSSPTFNFTNVPAGDVRITIGYYATGFTTYNGQITYFSDDFSIVAFEVPFTAETPNEVSYVGTLASQAQISMLPGSILGAANGVGVASILLEFND